MDNEIDNNENDEIISGKRRKWRKIAKFRAHSSYQAQQQIIENKHSKLPLLSQLILNCLNTVKLLT